MTRQDDFARNPASKRWLQGLEPLAVVLISALAISVALIVVFATGGRLNWNAPLFGNDRGLVSGLFLFMAIAAFIHGHKSPDWDPFSPFRVFYTSWFAALALGCLRLTTAESPFTARFWVTVVLGLLGFYLGGEWGSRGRQQDNRISLARLRGCWDVKWGPTRAVLLIGLFFLMCMGAFGYEWSKAGTVPLLADDPEAARFEFGVSSLVSRFVVSLGLVAVLGYLGAVHVRKHRALFLIMALASLAVLALITGRVFILTAIWMAVVLFHYGRRRIRARALLVFFLIAYPIAKSAVDLKRFSENASYNKLLDEVGFPETLRAFAPDYLYFSMTLHTLDYLTHLIPGEVRYSYGWYIGYPVRVFWTPRQGTGFRGRLDDLLWDRTDEISSVPSVTTSYMGVPYADFGLPGVFLFSALLGWISVRAYEALRRQPNFWRVFLYSQISFALFWSIYASYLTLFDFYWSILVIGLIHRVAGVQASERGERAPSPMGLSYRGNRAVERTA